MSAGFVSIIASKLVGKHVEIYQGLTHDEMLWQEVHRHRKSILCGKLIEASDECLVLECQKGIQTNLIYVNSWTVYSITELKQGASLFDMYLPDERKTDV